LEATTVWVASVGEALVEADIGSIVGNWTLQFSTLPLRQLSLHYHVYFFKTPVRKSKDVDPDIL
jgi:hypothetical protein